MKYSDPDGNEDFSSFLYNMFAQSCGNDGAEYIMKNDSSIKFACVAESALNGDLKAQQIVGEAAKGAVKDMAVDGLEMTANIAAGGLGFASEISSGIEIGARGTKAAITKDKLDIKKAKETALKNGGSFLVSRSVSRFSKLNLHYCYQQ